VLNNLQYPTSKNKGEFNSTCVETRKGTTLLLTRYEYVNLYHTLTDWWNAFFVLTPEQRSRKEKIRVLFLDGHAQGNLDPVWSEVYGPFEFVQHLTPGGVCLERAVLVPPGYMAPIFPDTGNQNADREPRIRCPRPILMERFCNFFLTAFGLEQLKLIPGKIVIIDRQPYISHPRSRGGRIARVLEGLDDLKERLLKIRGVTGVEVVRFEGLPVREQVRIVREAHILIGNHGAGLTHLAFMDPNAHVLEFTVGYLEFFDYLAAWKGIHHRSIGISDEDRLSGRDVLYTIETVEGMLSGSST
jgi:glycoprotein 2-beta-D-xylosyltransferase